MWLVNHSLGMVRGMSGERVCMCPACPGPGARKNPLGSRGVRGWMAGPWAHLGLLGLGALLNFTLVVAVGAELGAMGLGQGSQEGGWGKRGRQSVGPRGEDLESTVEGTRGWGTSE